MPESEVRAGASRIRDLACRRCNTLLIHMLKASQTGNDNVSPQAGDSSPPFQPAAQAQRAGTFHKEAFQSPPVGRMPHLSADDSADDMETGLASAFNRANDSLDLIRDESQAANDDAGNQSFHYANAENDVFNTTFYGYENSGLGEDDVFNTTFCGYENSGLGEDDLQIGDLGQVSFHLPLDLQVGSSPNHGRQLPPTPAPSPQRWTLPYDLTVGDYDSPEFSFQSPFAALTLDEAPLDAGPAQRTGGIEEAPTL